MAFVALADRRVGRLTRRRRMGSWLTYLLYAYACSLWPGSGRITTVLFGINPLISFPERAVVLGSDNQRAGDAVSGRVSAATVILAFDVPGHNSSSSREKTARSCRPSSPNNRRAWALSHRLVTDLGNQTEFPEPVTNQATTDSGDGRRNATYPDTNILLGCSNPTQADAIRRFRHAW